jgi:hypothetical protein
MAISRTSGSPAPNTVGADRYPLACARPAIPAPMTATPIDGVVMAAPHGVIRLKAL